MGLALLGRGAGLAGRPLVATAAATLAARSSGAEPRPPPLPGPPAGRGRGRGRAAGAAAAGGASVATAAGAAAAAGAVGGRLPVACWSEPRLAPLALRMATDLALALAVRSDSPAAISRS